MTTSRSNRIIPDICILSEEVVPDITFLKVLKTGHGWQGYGHIMGWRPHLSTNGNGSGSPHTRTHGCTGWYDWEYRLWKFQ